MTNNNWDSDELNLKNELKLIDDSYYRVYDDNDYEIWKERMLSIIENQSKTILNPSNESTEEETNAILNRESQNESTVNEINPIKPVFLELPNEIIIKGIEPKAPNIENCNMNVSWGMKYLLSEIDQKCQDSSEKTRFKSILLDSKPGRSKWNNPNRIGQDELYQGLEKPYSIPFLVKVSKKDVPDYYNVIKKPMDLGTMAKKLKNQEYISKQQFLDDLNLIYSNCFTYNTAEDSIYRQHIQMLRDKWTYLLKSVPEIVVGKQRLTETIEKRPQSKNEPISVSVPTPVPVTQSTKPPTSQPSQAQVESDPLDDLDDLINAHLESLSDSESSPSPKKPRKSSTLKSQVVTPPSASKTIDIVESYPKHSYLNDLSTDLSKRCDKLMIKYASDCKSSWGIGKSSKEVDRNAESSFLFPELVYFFNTVPDTHLIKIHKNSETRSHSYSSIKSMNRYYDNFRILQSIRDLRKHILEGSRAELPSIEHLQTPSNRFDAFATILGDEVENEWQAKVILRKIITLYLAQAGFELISNSALHALYELVDWNFKKFFDTLKLFNEQFSGEKESADILRLALLQMNIRHLTDLEVVAVEDSYAKSRLESLLSVMNGKVQDYESLIRSESTNTASNNEEDEDNDIEEGEEEDVDDQEEDLNGNNSPNNGNIDDEEEDNYEENENDLEEEEND